MMKRAIAILFLFAAKAVAQNFYDVNTIQKVELTFAQPNWDYMLDTAKLGAGGYIAAQSVTINGTTYNNVGVKYKGNSSYDSSHVKNPLHIRLDKYATQDYQGFTDIKLANCYGDPSMIREALSYDILKNYMDCSRSNFAQVYINGMLMGLYTNDEDVDAKFCGDHFYSSTNTFVQCNPLGTATPAKKSNFKYITGADSSGYFNFYTLQSKHGWNELKELCDTITNYPASLAANVDVDRAIWMLAFDNLLVNLDSYMGVFCQNHYIYKDNTNHFNPIIWDMNMSFGGFPYVGSGNSSMGSLTVANMQQLAANTHATDAYWPLIKDIQANAMYKRMYIAHMRTMMSEMFSSGTYQTKAAQMQSVVDTAVQSDVHKFFTYAQFQGGMNTNYTVGSYTVPGISNLMSARVSYLSGTTDFTATHPVISAVTPSNTSPAYNAAVTITASVSNTNVSSVYLGYRFDKTLKFTRVLMYDDGAHNDGASGDNVYGTSIVMSSGLMQYYIYAENNSAGMFSPERAEHEFYSLKASAIQPSAGIVVINELLANASSGVKDEYGEREDWIELYNNSSQLIDLSNTYLSTDATNLLKWKFPDTTFILPNNYKIIWADADSMQKSYHTDFKLNKTYGKLFLSNGPGAILDSISFSNQAADTTFGRYPNGTGPFMQMMPTYNAANSGPLAIQTIHDKENFIVYPNPANQSFTIAVEKGCETEVFNGLGQSFYKEKIGKEATVNTSNWPEGIYFIRMNNSVQKIIVLH